MESENDGRGKRGAENREHKNILGAIRTCFSPKHLPMLKMVTSTSSVCNNHIYILICIDINVQICIDTCIDRNMHTLPCLTHVVSGTCAWTVLSIKHITLRNSRRRRVPVLSSSTRCSSSLTSSLDFFNFMASSILVNYTWEARMLTREKAIIFKTTLKIYALSLSLSLSLSFFLFFFLSFSLSPSHTHTHTHMHIISPSYIHFYFNFLVLF